MADTTVDLDTLRFLALDDLVSDLRLPESKARALVAARDDLLI